MSGFVGNITNKIDAKGRVSIPAPFRAALVRDGYEGLYCYPSLDMKAIDAGGNQLLAVIGEKLAGFEPFTEDHDFLSTAFYGMSEALKIDQDGRVSLTDGIKDYAGITDQVTFVGQGYKFQIWDPARFAEHREEARRRAQALRRGGSRPVAAPGEPA